jgi:hypothetical protein
MARGPLHLPEPPDPEMSVDEAARALGRSRSYVIERIKAGVMPGKGGERRHPVGRVSSLCRWPEPGSEPVLGWR